AKKMVAERLLPREFAEIPVDRQQAGPGLEPAVMFLHERDERRRVSTIPSRALNELIEFPFGAGRDDGVLAQHLQPLMLTGGFQAGGGSHDGNCHELLKPDPGTTK